MANMPWQRMEDAGETEAAFEAFRVYLDTRRPRPNFRKFSADHDLAYGTVMFWHKEYNWEGRVRAYDEWMDETTDRERNKALTLLRVQVVRDEVNDYQKLHNAWEMMLDHITQRAATGINNGEFDHNLIEDLNKLAHARTRIDAMARKSAQMPSGYAPKEGENLPVGDEQDILLDFENGPTMIEGKVSTRNDGD